MGGDQNSMDQSQSPLRQTRRVVEIIPYPIANYRDSNLNSDIPLAVIKVIVVLFVMKYCFVNFFSFRWIRHSKRLSNLSQ